MINSRNKTIAFFLSALLTAVSWAIIIIYILVSVVSLFKLGLYNVNIVGFTFATILISIYTIVILFKVTSFSYFPVVLILLHLSTLNGSALSVLFIIADLALMVLLNTGASQKPTSQTRYYYSSSQQSNPFSSASQEPQPKQTIDDDNVFDAEYNTKE